MTGDGVTVFILDTLPKREKIMQAAEFAGDNNLLLQDVMRNVTFNYPVLPDELEDFPGILQPATGRDIYGRLVGFKAADHGLFVAGIVRDLAPNAHVECIRVLNDSCVGDTQTLVNALSSIYNRMLPRGDLYQKPVVINLSLIAMPYDEEMMALGLDLAHITAIRKGLLASIQSLGDLGAVFVASSGNESDPRVNPSGIRFDTCYPAALAYMGFVPPETMIPVGAVNKDGEASVYSCYPGTLGVATYGGEIPLVTPPHPPSSNPSVTNIDALIGLYTAPFYPALSMDNPQSTYPAPNLNCWAYWLGTSFATPIIAGVAARILEMRERGSVIPNVHDAILAATGTNTTNWDRLNPETTGIGSGSVAGPMLLARQTCTAVDEDDEDEEAEVDIEVIDVVVERERYLK
jgi:subtilisin family serine protease